MRKARKLPYRLLGAHFKKIYQDRLAWYRQHLAAAMGYDETSIFEAEHAILCFHAKAVQQQHRMEQEELRDAVFQLVKFQADQQAEKQLQAELDDEAERAEQLAKDVEDAVMTA